MGITSLLVAGTLMLIGVAPQYQHRRDDSPRVQGSGNVATQARRLGNFSRIRCDGAAVIEATIGRRSDVSVSADDNLLPLITTRIEGDTLVIDETANYNTKNKVIVKFSAPSLEGIDIAGAAQVTLSGLDGGGLDVTIAGAGNVTATGRVSELDIRIRGTGNLRLQDLVARSAKVDIAGVGNATLNVSDSLDATVSGVGNIRYHGNPRSVTRSVTGMGRIKAG